jgi:hypothetical protein
MRFSERLKLVGLALATPKRARVGEDSFRLRADADGVLRQPCWFCDATVELQPEAATGDAGFVFIDLPGTQRHLHGLCHAECAERSKGSQALDAGDR